MMNKNKTGKFKIFFITVGIILGIFCITKIMHAQEISSRNTYIYINGIELKLRNIDDEKAYFKTNNNTFRQYAGTIYKNGTTYMLPVKKTFNLAKVTYTIDNNGVVLSKGDAVIMAKFNKTSIDVVKDGKSRKITLPKEVEIKSDNSVYVPLEIFKYLNFDVKVDEKTSETIIEIKNMELSEEKIIQDMQIKYKDVFDHIKKSREKVKNTNVKMQAFINNTDITRQMSADRKDGKISISSGEYLENFHLGQMLLLNNGKIVEVARREKSKDFLNYYVSESSLDVADEMIIFCPYCKSAYIIKVKSPFRQCDCELD